MRRSPLQCGTNCTESEPRVTVLHNADHRASRPVLNPLAVLKRLSCMLPTIAIRISVEFFGCQLLIE